MKGFIEVSYKLDTDTYIPIICHYTQIFSNGIHWYWNDNRLLQNNEQIKELIKQAQE